MDSSYIRLICDDDACLIVKNMHINKIPFVLAYIFFILVHSFHQVGKRRRTSKALKRTDALSNYSEFLDWLKKKDLQCNKLVMKIALESPEALSNEDFENIVTFWA